jgi:hypothetical protein
MAVTLAECRVRRTHPGVPPGPLQELVTGLGDETRQSGAAGAGPEVTG